MPVTQVILPKWIAFSSLFPIYIPHTNLRCTLFFPLPPPLIRFDRGDDLLPPPPFAPPVCASLEVGHADLFDITDILSNHDSPTYAFPFRPHLTVDVILFALKEFASLRCAVGLLNASSLYVLGGRTLLPCFADFFLNASGVVCDPVIFFRLISFQLDPGAFCFFRT